MRSGSCPQQRTPPPELSFSVPRAIFTSLPVVVVLILLPMIAFASPPDASWIAGIYDDADGDDLVTLVYETAAVEAVPLRAASPFASSSYVSLSSRPDAIQGFPPCQFTRGPPSLLVPTVYTRHSRLQELVRIDA